MRFFLCLLVTLCFVPIGCAERPEVPASHYGTILKELPSLPEAEKPFDFSFTGGIDSPSTAAQDR